MFCQSKTQDSIYSHIKQRRSSKSSNLRSRNQNMFHIFSNHLTIIKNNCIFIANRKNNVFWKQIKKQKIVWDCHFDINLGGELLWFKEIMARLVSCSPSHHKGTVPITFCSTPSLEKGCEVMVLIKYQAEWSQTERCCDFDTSRHRVSAFLSDNRPNSAGKVECRRPARLPELLSPQQETQTWNMSVEGRSVMWPNLNSRDSISSILYWF